MAALMNRRVMLGGALASPLVIQAALGQDERFDRAGEILRPWQKGDLDIHHIATGRGDASLIVAPDGTTILIDAGAIYGDHAFVEPIMPSDDRRPGEWIGRYVARRLKEIGSERLDYAVISHIHPDHVGDVAFALPSGGSFLRTGISDVAAEVPIGTLLDRGYPDYAWPVPQTAPFAKNYIAFVQAFSRGGGKVARLRAGAADQIVSRSGSKNLFDLRTLAVNGEVRDGARVITSMPSFAGLRSEDLPDENLLSAAFRLTCGGFSYFAGGDLTSDTRYGTAPWPDLAATAAKLCGPVDVAVAPHHGLFDSTSAAVVRALRPRLWLIDAWHVSHPSLDVLERLYSKRLYPGARDVVSTALSPQNQAVTDRLSKQFLSRRGHAIIRVRDHGSAWQLIVMDNRDEGDRVLLAGALIS